MRHLVAHHGGRVRPIDAPRFVFYDVPADVFLNPTAPFVREQAGWLYELGSAFRDRVSEAVWGAVLKNAELNPAAPSTAVAELAEVFDYGGILLPPDDVQYLNPTPGGPPHAERDDALARTRKRLEETYLTRVRGEFTPLPGTT